MATPDGTPLTPEADVDIEPAPRVSMTVNAIAEGPPEGLEFLKRSLEGLAGAAKELGVSLNGLGDANKLESIFEGQNVLDNRLSAQRRFFYPQVVANIPDEVLGEWLFVVRTNDSGVQLTWMNVFLEGAVQAFLDDRITRQQFEDMVYGVWMNQQAQCIIHEAVEMQASTDWKHWKNPVGPDRDNICVELSDLLHFVVGGFIKDGKGAADAHFAYRQKNAENHARQDGTVQGREDYAAPATNLDEASEE